MELITLISYSIAFAGDWKYFSVLKGSENETLGPKKHVNPAK